MILDDIKTKLEEIDSNVFYGIVDDSMRETVWNYIVFERKNMSISPNKTGASIFYTVHLIREDFIPEGLELKVIGKMKEIPGMHVSAEGGTYEYVQKPNTNVVIEMFSVSFVKPFKG